MDDGTSGAIVARRLRALRLTGRPCASPEEAVGHLGAVQAQDYGPAKWAIGMRLRRPLDELVEQAFAAGRILRTHVLRPTWHFVLPADIRWLLTATAPRVQARSAYRYRQLGLDAATLKRTDSLLVAALRGGNQLTRDEAGAMLAGASVSVEGQRLPYILSNAELGALICSGPRRGKQQTYMLLEERAPDARDLPRDEALAELAHRYFTSHGPATVRDFATWASLTLAEVGAAVETAGPALRSEELGGLVFWMGAGAAQRAPALRSPVVRLVQGYDEYIMGYTETKSVIAPPGRAWSAADRPVANLVILLNGRVAGFWRRTLRRREVVVEVAVLRPFDDAQTSALEAEAARYGEFLGLRAVVRSLGTPASDRPQGP